MYDKTRAPTQAIQQLAARNYTCKLLLRTAMRTSNVFMLYIRWMKGHKEVTAEIASEA